MAQVTTDKARWLDAGCFRGVFFMAFVPNEKAWNKEMKKLKENEPYPTAAGHTHFFPKTQWHGPCCLVTLRDELEKTHTPLEISGVMVHECVHVFQFLKNVIGEDDPGMEMEAYTIQYIYTNMMNAFEEMRRPLKDCDK